MKKMIYALMAAGIRMSRMVAIPLLFMATVSQLTAAEFTWDGDTDGNWGTAANWDAAPTFDADNGVVIYNVGAGNLSTFLGTARTIGSIVINENASAAVTIRLATTSGGSTAANLILGSATVAPTITVTTSDNVTHIIGVAGGNVVLANDLTATHNGTIYRQLRIDRPVTETGGSFGITKEGTGLLYLNNTGNTYTGKTVVNGGRLRVDDGGSLGTNPGSFVADQLTLDGGSLYVGSGTLTMGNRGITLGTGGASFIANNASTFGLDGTIAGEGGLTLVSFSTGYATFDLQQANTFTGNTVIQKGILSLTHVGALQNSPYDTATSVAGDASQGLKTDQTTLKLGGLIGDKDLADIFITTSGGYGSVTAITLNTVVGKALSYSGVIDGARALTKTGAGTQTLTGTNTHNGTTTIDEGTLVFGADDVIAASTNLNLAGGILSMGSYSNTLGTLEVTGNATIALGDGTGKLVLDDSAALDANWNGILTLTGTLGANTVKFGTGGNALTAGQLASIIIDGSNTALNASGYLEAAPPPPPTVTIGAGTTDVAGTRSAYLRGEITVGITADAYICWGTVSNTTSTSAWQNVISVGPVSQDVPFTNTVTDLLYGQQYYYRVYATNASGAGWSAVEAFTKVVPTTTATGGEITIEDDGHYIHVFKSSGTFSYAGSGVNDTVEVLVVGGGGGGGRDGGGGGGGGGVVYSNAFPVSNGDITVTVGAGGIRNADPVTDPGTSGSPSYFGALEALGGGLGGSQNNPGPASGGSGGGGTRNYTSGGAGTAGQGYAGGSGNGSSAYSTSGGGGGAGTPGGNADTVNKVPGDGGDGLEFSQFASVAGSPAGWFGGGGGGGNWKHTTGSLGGQGGGGKGEGTDQGGTAGTANTGGGGGGGDGWGKNGGSGIVIVRYLPALTTTIATTTATNVTPFTATLRGTLDAENTVFAVTAYVSTSNNLTSAAWEADGTKLPVAAGSYTNAVAQAISGSATALSESTHYYYTFKAVTPSGNATIWAASNGEFTTRAYSTTFRFR